MRTTCDATVRMYNIVWQLRKLVKHKLEHLLTLTHVKTTENPESISAAGFTEKLIQICYIGRVVKRILVFLPKRNTAVEAVLKTPITMIFDCDDSI